MGQLALGASAPPSLPAAVHGVSPDNVTSGLLSSHCNCKRSDVLFSSKSKGKGSLLFATDAGCNGSENLDLMNQFIQKIEICEGAPFHGDFQVDVNKSDIIKNSEISELFVPYRGNFSS